MANINQAYNYTPSNTRYDIGISNGNQCAEDLIPNIIAIDSMRRDNKNISTSSDYTITLPQSYRDVVSIELVYADIPNGNYNITANNNKLYINVNDVQPELDDPVPTPISIAPGLYTLEDLLSAIELAVDAQYGGANFTVNSSDLTGKITMTADKPYTLYFQSDHSDNIHQPQSIAPVLGYRAQNVKSVDNSTTGSNSHNIEMDGTVSLHIHNLNRCDSNNNSIDGAFCLVPLDTVSPNYGLLKDGDTIQNDDKTYYFIQPQKIDKLRLSFRDWYGNIYDFNGYDHLLIFKVYSLSNNRKYTQGVNEHKHKHTRRRKNRGH